MANGNDDNDSSGGSPKKESEGTSSEAAQSVAKSVSPKPSPKPSPKTSKEIEGLYPFSCKDVETIKYKIFGNPSQDTNKLSS